MRRPVLIALFALLLAIAGCGGDDSSGGGGTSGGETPAATATATPSGGEGGGGESGGGGKDGKTLFAGTCGGCHTLKDAGTTGTFGPNLDELKPDKARVLNAIKTGPGPMPEGLFSGADADAVATYVSGAAGK
jgi:mono/diheme cytochrome c family protein